MGMRSNFFHYHVCDHPAVVTMSVWVGFHHGWTGPLHVYKHHFYGQHSGYDSGSFGFGSVFISLNIGHYNDSGYGFWECNTIYIIDKGFRMVWNFGLSFGIQIIYFQWVFWVQVILSFQ